MKNILITSISALVFLTAGLIIGRQEKRIEYQTIVKTNTIEKPVEIIVEKVVTNEVDRIIEKEIPLEFRKSHFIHNLILNAPVVERDRIPNGLTNISIGVAISKNIKDRISDVDLKERIEYELRKIGIKIDSKSPFALVFVLDGFITDDRKLVVYTCETVLRRFVYFFSGDNAYGKIVNIWENGHYGILEASEFNEQNIRNKLSDSLFKFCNKVLESREN